MSDTEEKDWKELSLEKIWAKALDFYHGTESIDKKEGLAYDMFLYAAEKGHQPSMLEVGCMYFMGIGTAKNFRHAIRWWSRLKNVDAEAQYGLGVIYFHGRNEENIEADADKALYFWKKAAHNHNVNAMEALIKHFPDWVPEETDNDLANYFRNDTDTPHTPVKGIEMFKDQKQLSVKQNHPEPVLTTLSSPLASQVQHRNRPTTVEDMLDASLSVPRSPSSNFSMNNSLFPTSPSTKQAQKKTNIEVAQIHRAIDYMKNQVIDISATVNVLNQESITENGIIKEALKNMRKHMVGQQIPQIHTTLEEVNLNQRSMLKNQQKSREAVQDLKATLETNAEDILKTQVVAEGLGTKLDSVLKNQAMIITLLKQKLLDS